MNAYLVLAIVGGVFGLLPIIWKSKGVHVFLLLCAGNLLSASLSGSITNQIRDIVRVDNLPLQTIVRATLLLLPALVGILISRHSVKKKRVLIHFIASLASAIVAYLWFIKTLPYEQFSVLENSDITKQLMQARDAAIGTGILASIILMWMERPKPDEDHKKGKHKK